MKTREDLIRMLGVLVTSAQFMERDYEQDVLRWKEYVRRKKEIALQLQVFVYVLAPKECFYGGRSYEDLMKKALALLDNANTTPSC